MLLTFLNQTRYGDGNEHRLTSLAEAQKASLEAYGCKPWVPNHVTNCFTNCLPIVLSYIEYTNHKYYCMVQVFIFQLTCKTLHNSARDLTEL